MLYVKNTLAFPLQLFVYELDQLFCDRDIQLYKEKAIINFRQPNIVTINTSNCSIQPQERGKRTIWQSTFGNQHFTHVSPSLAI